MSKLIKIIVIAETFAEAFCGRKVSFFIASQKGVSCSSEPRKSMRFYTHFQAKYY